MTEAIQESILEIEKHKKLGSGYRLKKGGKDMAQYKRKKSPNVTWENIVPPYEDYDYFRNCEDFPFRYNSNMFDIVNAWWLIEIAILVYSEENFVKKHFRKAGLKEVEFFSDQVTQCFVASDENVAIVAFRGSELRKKEENTDVRNVFSDWMANFKFTPVHWDQGGAVHEGFKTALDEVWEDLVQYIRTFQQKGRQIWMTGHSQGAALATLAADRYGNVQGVYTFGSPRVGNIDFKTDFFVNTYRFVNNNDLVTRLPPAPIYHHVGALKYIDSNGVIHDNSSRWERWTDEIQGQYRNLFNSYGQLRHGFSQIIPDPIKDHDPRLYAIHIWNNIPDVA